MLSQCNCKVSQMIREPILFYPTLFRFYLLKEINCLESGIVPPTSPKPTFINNLWQKSSSENTFQGGKYLSPLDLPYKNTICHGSSRTLYSRPVYYGYKSEKQCQSCLVLFHWITSLLVYRSKLTMTLLTIFLYKYTHLFLGNLDNFKTK